MLIRSRARHVWHNPRFVLERGDNRVNAIPPQVLKRIRQLADAREVDILGDALPLPSQADAIEQYHELSHLKQRLAGLEGLEADHARLAETLNERSAEASALREKHGELQQRLEQAEKRAKELSVHVESLEQENQSLTVRLAALDPPASDQGEAVDEHSEGEGEPDAEGKHKHSKRKR